MTDSVNNVNGNQIDIDSAICANIYDIYCVDSEQETVTVLRQHGQAIGIGTEAETKLDYAQAVEAYIKYNVFAKDQTALLNFLRLKNICKQLKKQPTISLFYRVSRNDELIYFRLKCVRLGDAETFTKFLCAFMPEDFETAQAQIMHTLETDEVTGAYTKQAFYQRAEEILDKNPKKGYDIIVTDIENFKMINRIYGRAGGDSALKYFAQLYAGAARGGLCARYGADQFVILSEAMQDLEVELFFKLVDAMRVKCPIPYINLRYGVYRNVDRNDTIAEMCDKAVLALRSKRNFRNDPIAFYDNDLVQKHLRTQMFESRFDQAIENHEFVVWCQPKYSSFTKRMTSGEALIRWKSSDGTFVSPGEFIPIFEQDGLIVNLDEYVFRFVCEQQKALLDSGIDPIPVAVNVSRATLYRPGSIARYNEIINEVGLDKKYVPLELTESATVENDQIAGIIAELVKSGFLLHMDDFGSGFSSLAGLAALPLHALKLDKSLIDKIGDNRGDELLRHIIEIAHSFQMEVIAEGVERTEQYNFLKKLSCDTIQGYLFSKPVPFDIYIQMSTTQTDEEFEKLDTGVLADEAVGSLRITNELKLQYLSALAGIYMTMHVINLKEDTVVEFATTTNVKEHANRAHNAAGQMSDTMTATVSPEYLQAVLEFTDINTIAARMKGKRTISAEFVGKHFGWFRARFVTVTTNENDEPETIIFTTQVIEADKRKEEMLIRACRTDELTGVFNKTAFDEDIKAIANPDNHEKENTIDLAVMTVDVLELKEAYDTLGIAAGDELIWGTADMLHTVLGKDAMIYRVGKGRFTAIFYTSRENAVKMGEAYGNAVHNWIGNNIRTLKTSYGIVSRYENPDAELEELIAEANARSEKNAGGQAEMTL